MESVKSNQAGAGGMSTSAQGSSLQSAGSLFSVLQNLGAASAARRNADAQREYYFTAANLSRGETELSAHGAELEASAEFIAGKARAVQLSNDLSRTIGGQRVAYAASGVSVSFGTAQQMQDDAAATSASNIALNDSNTNIRRLGAEIRAGAIRREGAMSAFQMESQGRNAIIKGENEAVARQVDAVASVGKTAQQIAARGGG
jgi:hypothetical protein